MTLSPQSRGPSFCAFPYAIPNGNRMVLTPGRLAAGSPVLSITVGLSTLALAFTLIFSSCGIQDWELILTGVSRARKKWCCYEPLPSAG